MSYNLDELVEQAFRKTTTITGKVVVETETGRTEINGPVTVIADPDCYAGKPSIFVVLPPRQQLSTPAMVYYLDRPRP